MHGMRQIKGVEMNKYQKIGALWINESQDSSEKILSGEVNGKKIKIFKNTFKEPGDKRPDYNICEKIEGIIEDAQEKIENELPF